MSRDISKLIKMAKATKTTDKVEAKAAEPEIVTEQPNVEETPVPEPVKEEAPIPVEEPVKDEPVAEAPPKEDFVEPSQDIPVTKLTKDEVLQKEIKALRLVQDEIVWQQFNWGKTPDLREPLSTMIDYMENHVEHARKALEQGDEATAYTRIRILAGVAFGVLQREDVPPREK